MKILAFALSVIGTVCICGCSLIKGKDMRLILFLAFLSNVFVGASYILTGAWNGALSCGVGAAQSIINYFFERKQKPLPVWLVALYALSFTAVNVIAFARFTDIFAILACYAYILGISQKSGKKFRVWSLTNAGLWLVYDLVSHSYGPVFTHVCQSSIAIFGMLMHDRQKKT